MREYAAKRSWTIVAQIKEVGSGAAQRELRATLIAAARRREIDVVLVWRLDRWGRSVADLVSTLQELQHLGVGFVSLTEALDLTTPAGRAMAGLLCRVRRVRTRDPSRACPRRFGSCTAATANASAARPRWFTKPSKPGNYTAKASANPRSHARFKSAEPPSAASWPKRNPDSSGLTQPCRKDTLHCHAGCSQNAVIAALRDGGLWRDSEQTARAITALYDYTDEAGHLLYQVVRQEPKTFLQRRPDGAGGWIWRKSDRLVLYRLPEVLEAPIVFVVEGEKDVETLRRNGFVATTNSGGAKATWLDSYTETLRGRECILVPDNDPVGWERVAKIAKALLGTAARIRVLDLPRDYKDISDWFGAGHSECELITMLEGVHAV